jgi:hypothetical protein
MFRKFRMAPWWAPPAPKGPHGPKGGAYMGLVVQPHLAHATKGKTLGFSYGSRQRKPGGMFSPWGHRLDLEAKAAPLAYLKGREGLGRAHLKP